MRTGIERILFSSSTCPENTEASKRLVKFSKIEGKSATSISMARCLVFNSRKCRMPKTSSLIPNISSTKALN